MFAAASHGRSSAAHSLSSSSAQRVVRLAPLLLQHALEPAAVDRADARVREHEPHVGRRPRDEQVGVDRSAAERDVTAAVRLAHDDRELRHRRPREPRDEVVIAGEDARALRVGPDHQTRNVLQEDDREVERVAHVGERLLLLQGGHVHHSGSLHRLARDDADRLAFEPGQRADHAASVPLAPLHDRAAVEDRLEHAAHVIAAPGLGRNERQQPVRIARGYDWGGGRGRVARRVRHVGQEALDRVEARILVVDDHVRGAVRLGGDGRAAELLA